MIKSEIAVGSEFVFTKSVNGIRNHDLVLNSIYIKKLGPQLWKNPTKLL